MLEKENKTAIKPTKPITKTTTKQKQTISRIPIIVSLGKDWDPDSENTKNVLYNVILLLVMRQKLFKYYFNSI